MNRTSKTMLAHLSRQQSNAFQIPQRSHLHSQMQKSGHLSWPHAPRWDLPSCQQCWQTTVLADSNCPAKSRSQGDRTVAAVANTAQEPKSGYLGLICDESEQDVASHHPHCWEPAIDGLATGRSKLWCENKLGLFLALYITTAGADTSMAPTS